MIYTSNYQSPFGKIKLFSDGEFITHAIPEKRINYKIISPTPAVCVDEKNINCLLLAYRWFDIYFSGKKPDFTLPLNPKGTKFQTEIWKILRSIPYGSLTTYGEIAKIAAKQRDTNTMSAQAIGNAIKNNPINIIIPCHRIIAKNNRLAGYNCGLDFKLNLLKIENIDISNLF